MNIKKNKEVITYFEIAGKFEDDLGWGTEKEFISTLKVKSNHNADGERSLEFAKEWLQGNPSYKPLRISIESELLNKENQHLREDGEQENIVELNLEDAELLRDALDKIINYLKEV